MKSYDLFDLATRNLREAAMRNSLTTLGISVGVASLVAMLSLGAGLQRLAGKQLGRSGLFDTIVVSSRADWRNEEDRRQNRLVQTGELRTLDERARQEIRSVPNVTEVYPDIRLSAEFKFARDGQPRSHFTVLTGLPAFAQSSEVFDDLQGSFFSAQDAKETIILGDFARELLDLPYESRPSFEQKLTPEQLQSVIGKTITLRYAERKENTTPGEVAAASALPEMEEATDAFGFTVERKEVDLKIVGVVHTEPYGGWRNASRGRVFIPTTLGESLNMIQPTDLRTMMRPTQGKSYFTLIVKVAGSSKVKEVQEGIKKMGFTTFSILDASKGLNRFFTFLDLFLGIFGSLALAVASLGIVNTLVMAILERRREIGIMKAIGASDADVKQLFFVEAGAMGVFGGAAGILLGWGIGRVINFFTNIYLERQDMPPENFWFLPWWLIASALAFSVLVSLISGLYPASRAAKLDPVQALRHD
jgi:ABC-type antimicrobial peptide transport system permease subunit